MVADLRSAVAAERQNDLYRTADRHRLVRRATSPQPAMSPRRRLGRWLVSAGMTVARDPSIAVLEARR